MYIVSWELSLLFLCSSVCNSFPYYIGFFTLGGFSLSSPMNPTIKKKFAYFKKRIKHIYPMYAMSLIFGLMNLLVVCRPSTFDPNFHWNGQPTDLYQPDGTLSPLFCEGTPAFKQSYWGSLVSTFLIYLWIDSYTCLADVLVDGILLVVHKHVFSVPGVLSFDVQCSDESNKKTTMLTATNYDCIANTKLFHNIYCVRCNAGRRRL